MRAEIVLKLFLNVRPWVPLIFFQKSESDFPCERRNILSFAPKREAHIIYTVSFIILTIIVMFSVSV